MSRRTKITVAVLFAVVLVGAVAAKWFVDYRTVHDMDLIFTHPLQDPGERQRTASEFFSDAMELKGRERELDGVWFGAGELREKLRLRREEAESRGKREQERYR